MFAFFNCALNSIFDWLRRNIFALPTLRAQQ